MLKFYTTFAFIYITTFSFGQHIMFQQNVNPKAQVLQQILNDEQNSLVLETDSETFHQVNIFNNEFSESYDVQNNKTTIDLTTLPLGNYIVQAKLDNKRIIMYLEKSKDLKQMSTKTNVVDVISEEDIQTKHITKNITKKKKANYYWVISESNSNFGSKRSMRLEYKADIEKLISKHKLELRSGSGKDNTLVIYAIHNKSKFMNKQFRNPEYYETTDASKHIDAEPYYASNVNSFRTENP